MSLTGWLALIDGVAAALLLAAQRANAATKRA
jgi:hypothetical protein